MNPVEWLLYAAACDLVTRARFMSKEHDAAIYIRVYVATGRWPKGYGF